MTDEPVSDGVAASTARREPLAAVLIILLVATGIPFLMPEHLTFGPTWLLATIEVGLIVTMVALDPGRIDRHSAGIRRVRLALIGCLALGASGAAVALTVVLVEGHEDVSRGGPLLTAGALVWTGLAIAFRLLYWELDSGGPGARTHEPRPHPDLAFPQQLSPEVRPPGWQPHFVDYLDVGVTNGLAFSPTDAMPLAHWTKLAMGVQSVASLALIGLVIARAVNVLQ